MGTQSERPTVRYLPQVLLATGLMVGAPIALVWTLLASGTVTSVPLVVAIAVTAALLIGQAGSAVWKRRPGGGDLLWGELLAWGWLRRLWSERRLASAIGTIGAAAGAGELDPAQQAERLERLTAALEASDPYTHGHSRRVARHAATIAKRMHLPAEQVARIRAAAAVHDVGKINTPPAVLRKRGVLTDEEFDLIKRHPVDGARMVSALGDAELTRSVLHHHERLDGSGYPEGISGEEIPVGARIIAVADTFDAIASARPYRGAKTHREALGILAGVSGAELDPTAVRAFLSHYSDSRPLAIWTALASVPERMASLLGGGLNAASTAAAGAAVATVAALGATIAEPAHDAPERNIVSAEAAQVTPSSSPGHQSADSQTRRHRNPNPSRSTRGASDAPGWASDAAASPGAATGATAQAVPATPPNPGAGDHPQAVAVSPPSAAEPETSRPEVSQPDRGGTAPGGPADRPRLLPRLPLLDYVLSRLPNVPGSVER